MKIISTNKQLSIREMKREYMFTRAVRAAEKGQDHTIAREDGGTDELVMISKIKLDQMLQVNAAKSLPIYMKTQIMPMVTAGVRAEEVYRLVLGKSNFPGNDNYSQEVGKHGFEKRIISKGTDVDALLENKVAASGKVTANHPIVSLESVSARKPGAALTIAGIEALNLGVVELNDGASPVADGVAVELVYQAKEHLVIELQDQKKKSVAAIISKELFDYLVANA